MKKIVMMLTLVMGTHAFASCKVLEQGSLKVAWKAFKTPLKVGVGGAFEGFDINTESAATIYKALEKTSVAINTSASSVNTKNKARDAKISKFFFDGTKIKANVVSASDKKIKLNIEMFGAKNSVELKPTVKGSKLMATGHLDILDFKGSKQLAAINKACLALHEGKTWSDVEVSVEAKFINCK